MNTENPTYGGVVITGENGEKKTLKVVDFLRMEFADHRLISVSRLEDGESYLLTIENPASTGRATQTNLLLTMESYISLLTTALIFFEATGVNVEELLRKAINNKGVLDAEYSLGLKDFFDRDGMNEKGKKSKKVNT